MSLPASITVLPVITGCCLLLHFLHSYGFGAVGAQSLCCVQLFVTPRAPLPMGLDKNTGVEGHFLLQGIFPDLEMEPAYPSSPALQVDSLPLSHWGSPSYGFLSFKSFFFLKLFSSRFKWGAGREPMCAAHLVLLKPVVSFSYEWTVLLYKLVSKTKSNWFHGGLEWKHLSNPVILFKKKEKKFFIWRQLPSCFIVKHIAEYFSKYIFPGHFVFSMWSERKKKKQQRLKHQAVCLFNVSGTLPW